MQWGMERAWQLPGLPLQRRPSHPHPPFDSLRPSLDNHTGQHRQLQHNSVKSGKYIKLFNIYNYPNRFKLSVYTFLVFFFSPPQQPL